MLKRDNKFGEPHTVPGSTAQLTDSQLEAYNAGFRAIEHELLDVKQVREQLTRLEKVNLDKPVPKAFATITTPEGEWNAQNSFKNQRRDQSAVLATTETNQPRARIIQIKRAQIFCYDAEISVII